MSECLRWLYLHGFASGPQSSKGVAYSAHFAEKGAVVERLDLRQPSFEHLRLSAMIRHVIERIGGPRDRAVLFGSSLGGLTAARVAERDPRVCGLVLMAPAFGFATRWPKRLGDPEMTRWRSSGWLEVDDYTQPRDGRGKSRVDIGFLDDAMVIDEEGDGWPDVRVPTLIFHGSRDETVDISGSREWASARRNVRLVELDDGHELVASLPLMLAEAERFLAPFLGV